MRLLNTITLQLEIFNGDVPPYAILSHRWEDEEVTLQDLERQIAVARKGCAKLERSAEIACELGFNYIWNDTCCIDKSSSAELTECINSMWRFYAESSACIAYLSDIGSAEELTDSLWFTRGYTLQELIAPKYLIFYDKNWKPLGDKTEWSKSIHKKTGIPLGILNGGDVQAVSIACKMSWAAERVTTRPEDVAYCLLGIFDVNMPLLYGEGAEKAFTRLQEAIVRQSDDETIFAWTATSMDVVDKPWWGLLAPSPAFFKNSAKYHVPRFQTHRSGQPTEVTNRGLRLSLGITPLHEDLSKTQFLAVLNCVQGDDGGGDLDTAFTMTLQKMSHYENQFARVRPDVLMPATMVLEGSEDPVEPTVLDIYVRSHPRPANPVMGFLTESSQVIGTDRGGPSATYSKATFALSDPWTLTHSRKEKQMQYIKLTDASSVMSMARIEVDSFRERMLVACTRLRFNQFQYPNELRAETSRYKDRYLLIGLEPLPPNAMGTPHAFIRPWFDMIYSKNENVIAGILDGVPSLSLEAVPDLSPGLQVEFEPVTHEFRTFYEIKMIKRGKNREQIWYSETDLI